MPRRTGGLRPTNRARRQAQTHEARAKAEPVEKKFGVGKAPMPGMDATPATKVTGLSLVHPNGLSVGVDFGTKEGTARLSLAWVLYYPLNDEMWIDAADGKGQAGTRSIKTACARGETRRLHVPWPLCAATASDPVPHAGGNMRSTTTWTISTSNGPN